MRTNITLFDIPCTTPIPISPFVWKVRLVLNYKKLSFRNQWVPASKIEATCKELGIGPTSTNADGSPYYTLPAIIDRTDPAHTVILSDSVPIIEYLERTYPAPPEAVLIPPGTREMQLQFNQNVVTSQIMWTAPDIAANAHLASKVEEDKADFKLRFERLFGKPFDEIEKRGEEREAVFKHMEKLFKGVADMIDKNEKGSFIMGERIRFVDIALCGCIIFIKTLSPNEAWVRISSWDGGRWARYFNAFEEFTQLGSPPMTG